MARPTRPARVAQFGRSLPDGSHEVPSFKQLTSRLLLALSGAALGMTLLAPAASAAPSAQHGGNPTAACNGTHHSDSGHGANQRGAYDETCDGSPSGNGNGGGQAKGRPCAGCVGNADDKNPPGQAPNGSDHNAGYECDRNHGVGRTNPAHTGCRTASASSTPTGTGSNGVGQGTKKKVPAPVPPKPKVDPGAVSNGTPASNPPAPVGAPLAVDALAAPAPAETAVLGVSFVKDVAGDDVARVASAAISPIGASELPRTGGNEPDLLTMGLGLVALGTALRRAGRVRR